MPDLRECLKLFRSAEIYFWKVTPVCPKLLVRYFMDVKLPKLGEGADSGVVVNIFVKEGDTVAKDQAILELENEKAVASIPSTGAGVVAKVHVKSGDRVGIGARLITITENGQSPAALVAAAPAPKSAVKKTVAQAAPAPEEIEEESAEVEEEISDAAVATSPSIRKMARELGINLGKIRGSESGGRIVIGDVRAYIQRLVKAAAKPPTVVAGTSGQAKPAAVQIDFSQWGPVTKKSVTPLRKVIARRMAESWNTVARVTQFDDIDFTKLGELRKKFRRGIRKERRQAHPYAVRFKSGCGHVETASDLQFELG